MESTATKLRIGQEGVLSKFIDVSSQNTLLHLERLLPTQIVQTGVYDTPRTLEQLKAKLQECSFQLYGEHTELFQILKLYDIGVGTPGSVSDSTLRGLVDSGLVSGSTPVYFRCLYGGLFLFILTNDIETKYLKSEHTYIYVVKDDCSVFSARIGPPTHPNQVWMRKEYDGKTSSLAKTLSIPYLTSYCITTEQNFYSEDIPF